MRKIALKFPPPWWGRENSGTALIEFTLVLPVLLILLIGLAETAHYAMLHQKLDKTAAAMADFVTQGTSVSTADLNGFAQAVPQIMRPYGFDGTIIFSSAAHFTAATPPCAAKIPCISWQYATLGKDASRIGAPGKSPSLPGGYSVASGQNVIVAEAFLHYQPLLGASAKFIKTFTSQTLYKTALLKPRQGTLTALKP